MRTFIYADKFFLASGVKHASYLGFSPKYDLDVMTKDMLEKLKEKLVETV
ncbi:hypothetical protein [Enterococcus faecium]|nr:hypothetical protein [Enterococcus faecium]